MQGCIGYRKKLTCPPHVPTVDEFREILKEYRYALLVKFRSPAVADEEIAKAPYKTWLDPAESDETREKAGKFWSDYFDYSKKYCSQCWNLKRLPLTRVSPLQSHLLTVRAGSVKSATWKGTCVHSNMARIPEHAVGINVNYPSLKPSPNGSGF